MIAAEGRPVKTIYANVQQQVTLVCEQCGKAKVMPVADCPQINKPLKARCGCGHVFFICIQVRKCYRKPTTLPGTYVQSREQRAQGFEAGNMIVVDLSRTGLRLRTKIKHTLQVEDVIHVRFHLDDRRHSVVDTMARVKWVDAHEAGATFLDWDTYNDSNRALTLYLMA